MQSSDNNNPRVVALEAICSVVLKKESLSAFKFPQDIDDLSLAKSLTYNTIRFYHQLNDIVSSILVKPIAKKNLDIHCLILLGANQILFSNIPSHAAIFETVNVVNTLDKSWAKGLVNAVLREIDRNKDVLVKKPHFSHPSWMLKKIKNYYPDNFKQIFSQNNTQAPMSIRVHPKHNLGEFQNSLESIGIESLSISIAPQLLILENAVDVLKLPDFENGSCYVQDASAQLAGHIMSPKNGELVLDACAAPGGKTTHLSEIAPSAVITALDSDELRINKIKQNIERYKLNNIKIAHGLAQNQDWWDGIYFDKILLDAPCSASGVIRRHPDIKLLRKPKDITSLTSLQKDILNNLWNILKPGGALLYATCSVLKSENEHQISNFLQTHNDAIEEKISIDWGFEVSVGRQQLPSHNFDGFYYAKLIKIQY